MPLNFNVDPYYDDFDPAKNYHRILFKPGFAVQARELTQAQTILQDQITKFADNIFKQNTPVTGGQTTTNFQCYYIKLQETYNNITVDVNNTGDLVGSVFADDSTVMIDSLLAAVNLDGTVRGNVIPNNNGVHNIGSGSNKFNVITATTVTGKIEATTDSAPTANADPGNTGEIRYDDSFIYIKTASGWKKAALSAIV